MAREVINVGSGNNTNDGDPLRTAGIKMNNNFENIYNISGWGFYVDDNSSTQVFNTTPSKLTINSLGLETYTNFLPLEIRLTDDLWASNKIKPISVGDSYDVRINLFVTAKTGIPTEIYLKLDVGGSATPTNVVLELDASILKTPPYIKTFVFPIFTLSTFLTNGGQIFLSTDTGSVTVGVRSIFIKRDFKNI